jgi:hypothetical protein
VLGVDVLEGLVDPLDESSDSMHVVAVRRVAAVIAIVDPAETVRSYESIKVASLERTREPALSCSTSSKPHPTEVSL